MKNLIYCGMLIVHCLLLFVVDVSIAGALVTYNVVAKSCAKDNEYCQSSYECCSKRCLSFSYKCIKGPSTSTYTPSASIGDPSTGSVGTLEELVDRFGGDDYKAPSAQDQHSTTSHPLTSLSASTEPINSTTISSNLTSTISSTIHTNSQCVGIGYKCADSSQCCSNECLHYNDVHICIEQRTTAATATTAATTVPPNGQCLLIGQKCYQHEECCTRRCHGFLHQCVT